MDHVGIDVHQKYSQICELSARGRVLFEGQIPTTERALRRHFGSRDRVRIVLETGSSTPWVHRLLESLGHEVVVVNPRRVRLIAESTLKTDRVDAQILARLSRMGKGLLHPVYQRSVEGQLLRSRLKVRTSLVRLRTSLVNSVRGTLRSHGYRMRCGGLDRFVERVRSLSLPVDLLEAIEPLLDTLEGLGPRLARLHRALVAEAGSEELPVRLQTVPGVGPVVSLSFIAWMDRAERFAQSRDVGACLGLRPKVRSSGGKQWRGRITREGDSEMRRLLVQAAHMALRSRQQSALRKWAVGLVGRCGKKKAVVALARKIGVLLHHLWVSGESFRSFPRTA